MIAIIGGGPAGLAAAILLARAGREVVVHEAGVYPRHRVCGEFLSPDAETSLAELGLAGLCDRLAAPTLRAVRVTVSSRGRATADVTQRLPDPARGVSRFDLDAALAAEARSAGADVRESSRIADAAGVPAEHVILATGRQKRPVESEREGPRGWIGVKVHVRGLALGGVTELHFVRGAYVGMADVVCAGERVVNVCALLRRDAFDGDPYDALAAASPAFAQRWRVAVPSEETRCATAGFDFAIRGAPRDAMLCAGDAAALVAPFVGDGQAMALDAGILAAQALLGRGDPAAAMERAFAKSQKGRLRLARTLQRALLVPSLAAPMVRALGTSVRATAWLYRATRGRVTRPGASGVSK